MAPQGSATTDESAMSEGPRTAEMEVLCVDDDEELVETTALMLSHEIPNLETTVETDPKAVIEIIERRDIDCIICDYDMPEVTGLDVLKQVRERNPDLPFILFTGRGSEDIASQAISEGVTDYLQKSGVMDQYAVLSNRVMNAIGKYRAEQTLSDIRQFQKLVEYATDVISVVDQNGQFRFVTPSSAHILGYAPEEMLGTTGFDYVHSDDRMAVMEAFATAVEQPDHIVTEKFRFDHPDGWIWLESRARNMVGDPDVGGLVIYSRDITELEEREREYERLEQFASSISRDLRKPLDVASERLESVETAEELADVESALLRMEESLDDLITLAHYDEAIGELTPVSLERCVSDAWSNVAVDGLELSVEGSGEILADPPRLKQLLENLYRNTVDHATGGGQVEVGTLEDGFYVEDDGIGIPPQVAERIWEMGYSTRENGTGVGLAIVKEISHAHEWNVEVVEGAAGGARFEFSGVQFA